MIKQVAKSLLPKPIWAFLRSKRIEHLVDSYQHKVREGKYGGHSLRVSIQDPLGEGWYGQDWEFTKELEILRKMRLKKGAKVFDLGAHQSVVAMIFAAEVGAQGKVLAVEANEHNYRVGCENKKINHLEQLEILHGAVAKVAGTVEFSDDLNGTIKNNLTTSQSRSVRAFSIDDLIQKYFLPDLIVLDIEGYEALALEGAAQALSHKIDWYIEVHEPELLNSFGRTVDDVLKPFLNGPYQVFVGSETAPFVPFTASSALLQDRFFMIAHHTA